MSSANVFHGVGRRKSAVARVWLKTGTGKFTVNGKDSSNYFDTDQCRDIIKFPLDLVNAMTEFDVNVNVKGGGKTGQADAVKLGVARALLLINPENKIVLKSKNLLTVDSRIKERKKPGQKGARKKFQFVKR